MQTSNDLRIVFVDYNPALCNAWACCNPDIPFMCGDYFIAGTEAVTSPGNSFGFMDGGLDYVISQRLGWQVQKDLQKVIDGTSMKELLVGQAVYIETNNTLPVKGVVCAPTMRVPLRIDPIDVYLSTKAAVICALRNGVKSLTLPGMGMGTGGVDFTSGVKMMGQGIADAFNPKPFPATLRKAAHRHYNFEKDFTF